MTDCRGRRRMNITARYDFSEKLCFDAGNWRGFTDRRVILLEPSRRMLVLCSLTVSPLLLLSRIFARSAAVPESAASFDFVGVFALSALLSRGFRANRLEINNERGCIFNEKFQAYWFGRGMCRPMCFGLARLMASSLWQVKKDGAQALFYFPKRYSRAKCIY